MKMRKLILLAALAAVLGMASCGGHTSADTTEEDSLKIDTVAVLDEPVAPTALNKLSELVQSDDDAGVSSLIGQVVEQLQNLVADGRTTAAAEYAGKVRDFIETNKERLQNLNIDITPITDLVNKAIVLPAEAAEAADAATAAVKADVERVKQAVKDAANQKAEEMKTAADQKVEDAKAKLNEKMEDATNKAVEKTNEAIDNAAAAAKKKLGL